MQKCYVAAAKVFGYIDAEPDVRDKPGAEVLGRCRGEIELRDVRFSYHPDAVALRGVSLRFEPGKKYALVGQSGSGKSTLLALVLRFYEVDEGAILIDGRDLRDVTQESLRNQFGLVSQDTFLFTTPSAIISATVASTRPTPRSSAPRSSPTPTTSSSPSRRDTRPCSRQGLHALGRPAAATLPRPAILRDAPVLFLDEATSALDSESEKAIQEALAGFSKGKTVVAIAHRLSTVLDSDEIVVMGEGRVLDMAPHEILLSRSAEYRRLYELQFSEG